MPPAPAAPSGAAPVPPAPMAPAGASPAPPAAPGAAAPPAPAAGEKKAEEKKEPEKAHVEPKEGRVVILSSADMMKNDFLEMQGEYQPNLNFFYNTIESFGLDERLMKIRRRELTERRFKEGSGEGIAPGVIQNLNIWVLPLLVGVFGVVRFLVRKAESNAYERQYIAKSQR